MGSAYSRPLKGSETLGLKPQKPHLEQLLTPQACSQTSRCFFRFDAAIKRVGIRLCPDHLPVGTPEREMKRGRRYVVALLLGELLPDSWYFYQNPRCSPRSCCWLSESWKLETCVGHTMPVLISVYRKEDRYLQEQKH